MFMMRLPGLVFFTWVLPDTARRSVRTGDSQHGAQQQTKLVPVKRIFRFNRPASAVSADPTHGVARAKVLGGQERLGQLVKVRAINRATDPWRGRGRVGHSSPIMNMNNQELQSLDPQQELGANPEPGKFVRQSELPQGFGPLGVLCGGFGEDELEVIADVVETVFGAEGHATAHVPIVPLAQADMLRSLRDVLAQLNERDGVIPEEPIRLSTPLVLLSGFSTAQTSLMVRAIRHMGLQGRSQPEPTWRWPWVFPGAGSGADGKLVEPMFAVAVPRGMDKPLSILCEEIEGDYQENLPGDDD